MDKQKVLRLARGELETHYATKLVAGEMIELHPFELGEEGRLWKNGGEQALNRLVDRLRRAGFYVRRSQYHAGGNAFLAGVRLSETPACSWCTKDAIVSATDRHACADHQEIIERRIKKEEKR